jgi:subtilisin family serine protease
MLKKILKSHAILILVLNFFLIMLFQIAYATPNEYVQGEIIVKYKNKHTSKYKTNSLQSSNLSYVNKKYNIISTEKTFKNFDPKEVAKAFKNNPNIEYAEPNYICKTYDTPNDPYFYKQWALNNTEKANIDAIKAWNITKGNKNIIIAVIDTGVDYNHKDLINNIWINTNEIPGNGIDDDDNGFIDDYRGWDFSNYTNNPLDTNSHGTHCAGIIGAKGNNNIGISGICLDVQIMPLKCGSYFLYNTHEAIKYAADNGAKIINCSFGATTYSKVMNDAVQYARSKGVLVIAAAGNDNNNTSHYPSDYDGVISVAATDNNDKKATFSNYGDNINVSAPGEYIYSTIPNNGYDYKSGTSMACPMVSGLAGLILSNEPNITELELSTRIKDYTDNIDKLNPKYKNKLGSGRINVYRSLTKTAAVQDIKPDITESILDSAGNIKLNINPLNEEKKYIKTIFGNINIKIPKGTFFETENIQLKLNLTTPPISDQNNIKPTNIALEISTNKSLQPSIPIEVEIFYRDMDIKGLDEKTLMLMRYDEFSNKWIKLPSKVDVTNNKINAKLNHFSTFVIVSYTISNNLDNAKAYPNPFNPTTNSEGMKIVNITKNATIRIFNILGQLVREIKDNDGNGFEIWDGKNKSGNTVASGIYIIYIKGISGSKKIKVAVEK